MFLAVVHFAYGIWLLELHFEFSANGLIFLFIFACYYHVLVIACLDYFSIQPLKEAVFENR